MKKHLTFILAISMLLSGCQAYEDLGSEENEVRIHAVYPSSELTKITENNFDAGDQIGFYMVKHLEAQAPILQYAGNYATNIQATFSGLDWVCAPKVLWEEGVYDFYAYHPYLQNPNSIDELNFQVELDQREKGYEHSDFLWAKTPDVMASESSATLVFSHKLSRMHIVFQKGDDYTGDLPENADVFIHNTNPHAIIDLRTGDVLSNTRMSTKTIQARHISGASYEAIVVPQRLSNRVPLIEVVVDKISYLIESRFIFKQGMNHTYTIILSDNPEKIKVEIGGGIENWE